MQRDSCKQEFSKEESEATKHLEAGENVLAGDL